MEGSPISYMKKSEELYADRLEINPQSIFSDIASSLVKGQIPDLNQTYSKNEIQMVASLVYEQRNQLVAAVREMSQGTVELIPMRESDFGYPSIKYGTSNFYRLVHPNVKDRVIVIDINNFYFVETKI